MSYAPNSPPQDPANLPQYVYDELLRISAVFELAAARSVEFYHTAPVRPREGMVRGADGSDWDPGSGKGVYVYYDSAWHKLG
jgi:hypothetical protein